MSALAPPPIPQAAAPAVPDNKGRSGLELLSRVFDLCEQLGVSDIQLRSERYVYVETNKGMEVLPQLGVFSRQNMSDVYRALIENRESQNHGFGRNETSDERTDAKIREAFEKMRTDRVDDFACNGIPMTNGKVSGRLRIQVHLSASGLGITCRILNDGIPPLDVLGIDPDTLDSLKRSVQRRAGLCLVTGPTGSGKSTTLAALIDWLRQNKAKHIVTVEDPVEYAYPFDMDDPNGSGTKVPAPSVVTQQEVGRDLDSYRQGLKDVLRKAPHVILVGEIRDREAMDTCLEAAQTGHLVLSTLHTTGAVKTMGRILEMYPSERQQAVLNRLGEMMVFIMSQGLLKGVERRVLTYEFLQNDDDTCASAIMNYSKGATALEDVIRRGGNVQWDANLKNLLKQGLISEEAFENARMNREVGEELTFS
ncbi:MAG: ATPase, T2SS/T4P/T4SS family [Verrucomicrobiota bacterium JB023]|nr:ATPase, T2SS/T4P/T4SS family [Verrucomicrobiota bacterium JB023]